MRFLIIVYGQFFRAFYSHYREDGLKRVEKTNEEIAEDLYIFTVSQEPLSKKDCDVLKEEVKDRHVTGLVEHRTTQILSMEAAKITRQQMAKKARD